MVNNPLRVKKRKRAEPIPRNAFPHVVEKVYAFPFASCGAFLKKQLALQGLVTDSEARELFNM